MSAVLCVLLLFLFTGYAENYDSGCVVVSRNGIFERCELVDAEEALCGEDLVRVGNCLPRPRSKSCQTCLEKDDEDSKQSSADLDSANSKPTNTKRVKRGIRIYRIPIFTEGGAEGFIIWILVLVLLALILGICSHACGCADNDDDKPEVKIPEIDKGTLPDDIQILAIPMPWHNNYKQFVNDSGAR